MYRGLLAAVAGTAMFVSYPCLAQSAAVAPSSGGATSPEPASSGGTISGGASSQPGVLAPIASQDALSAAGPAGNAEASSLSTKVLIGVGGLGLIVGAILVTFNHGNQAISTTQTQ